MSGSDSCVVLAFGTNDWDGYWQTRQHVLSRLAARGWTVGYTTPVMSIWERNEPRWQHAPWTSREVDRDGVRVHYPGRWPPLTHRSLGLDHALMRRHARNFRGCIRAGGRQRVIAYVFQPAFLPYVEAIEPCQIVYHADDNFSAMPHADPQIGAMERAIVRRADAIFAITDSVARGLGDTAASKTLIVPNGADAELYGIGAIQPVPADLASIPGPTVAYAGSLNEKVDFALIARLASARPAVHWVLIGPVWGDRILSARSRSGLESCHSLPNVHFLGRKDYRELPAYCAHVDANAMFYRVDGEGWWRDIYPLKLHECLATGRPLLSADTPAVREFADVVAICHDDAQWLGAVDAALAGRGAATPVERIAVARANSWDVRVDRIESALRELLQAVRGSPSGKLPGSSSHQSYAP